MDESDWKFIASVQLSIHGALLGEVIPGLRAIGISWKPGDEFVWIYFIHDGEVNDEIQYHYSCIVAETEADWWGRDVWCRHKVIPCDYPNPIPQENWLVMVYERKEPFVNPS